MNRKLEFEKDDIEQELREKVKKLKATLKEKTIISVGVESNNNDDDAVQ